MREQIRKHYHWVIAVVAIVQMLIYGGASNNFSGYHMIPVTAALGISRTAFSLAESIRSIATVTSTFFSGALIRRFGYRRAASVALLMASIAYVLFSSMQAYWMLVLGCVMMGMVQGICFVAGVSSLVNVWFHKYRGTILGLVTAATGVGSTFLGFLQAPLIENISWRASFSMVAVLQLCLAVLVFSLVRSTPASIGLRPFGDAAPAVEKAHKRSVDQWSGFSMEFLRKRPAYYLLCVCAFLSGICILTTQFNIVPFFQDCGMSVTRASRLYGAMMLALGVFKLLIGILCDAVGAKRVLLLCHVACTVGLAMVMLLPQTDLAMIIALIVYVIAIPITTMMFPLVSAELFGRKAQTQYIGTVMAMTSAGSIISSTLANAVYDFMGSYRPVFWGSAVLSLVMIPAYCLLYQTVKRDKLLVTAEQQEQ